MPSVLIESLESGLDFIEFLGDRVSLTDRKELRDIYNTEFKGRYDAKVVLVNVVDNIFETYNLSHFSQGRD